MVDAAYSGLANRKKSRATSIHRHRVKSSIQSTTFFLRVSSTIDISTIWIITTFLNVQNVIALKWETITVSRIQMWSAILTSDEENFMTEQCEHLNMSKNQIEKFVQKKKKKNKNNQCINVCWSNTVCFVHTECLCKSLRSRNLLEYILAEGTNNFRFICYSYYV